MCPPTLLLRGHIGDNNVSHPHSQVKLKSFTNKDTAENSNLEDILVVQDTVRATQVEENR